MISTASHCQEHQTSIYFLKHFNKWITSDKAGKIYVWDIEEEEPERSITCKFKTKINDLCEIPALNLVAIVQENKNPVDKPKNKKTIIRENRSLMSSQNG